ncbi:ATP-dependent RNA helicase DDX46 [Gracilaria domingensis]|nr:ATP-dependent RNA helicase DDX46 [Gracilaria domingensis]
MQPSGGRRRRSRFGSASRPSGSGPQTSGTPQTTQIQVNKPIDNSPLVFSTFKRGKSQKRRQRAGGTIVPSPSDLESNERNRSLNSLGSSFFNDDEQDEQGVHQNFTNPVNDGEHIRMRKKRPLFLRKREEGSEPTLSTSLVGRAENTDEVIDPLDNYMQTMDRDLIAKRPRHKVEADINSDGSGESGDDKENPFKPNNSHKRKVYEKVDHSKIDYPPFQKNLYIEVPQISKMKHAEVAALRRKLGNIRIRGKRCPRPVTAWAQCGLSASILNVLERLNFHTPTGIQAQAIPCVMSGRDVIGIARTGSGKTLAFLLPIFRHIALRERSMPGEGPSALIIAPTRELAIQIYGDAKKFSNATDIRCVCAYGGSGVKDQIAELKRGADLVVCTPGRMIDLLAMNGGRITNLLRVTFVLLDEADRMFDMGFEPQLTRIIENIRPDRQTVMFSATFPAQVERLARKILNQPVEIMVGGNSVAAATIDQHVEVRNEESKFFRLLELLGTWYEQGSTLVFVDRQDNADRIFRDLCKARYKCLSLHGGMDQADRDSTIVDFKNGDVKVLVATSVAARGLDVKNLTLVVNYDVPSHYEDYVHRVGRTGRAGAAGTAYTFITPDQEAYAGDLAKALTLSARTAAEQEAPIGDEEAAKKAGDEAVEAAVPEKLQALVESFEMKRKAGVVKYGANSGYGGRGFKFDENEEYNAAQKALRKMQAVQYGPDDDEGYDGEERKGEDGNDDDDDDENDGDDDGIVRINKSVNATGIQKESGPSLTSSLSSSIPNRPLASQEVESLLVKAVKQAEASADTKKLDEKARRALVATAKARVLSIVSIRNKNAAVQRRNSSSSVQSALYSAPKHTFGNTGLEDADAENAEDEITRDSSNSEPRFACELEINDYPQHARWQVTRKNSLNDVEEFTGCVITTRGNFYPPGRNPPPGERKLHFLLEGPTRRAVKMARRDIRQKLEEASQISRPSDHQYSKYSVV